MKITDEMLFDAAPDAEAFLVEHTPLRPEPAHLFSKRFDRKMNGLIRQERRGPVMKQAVRFTKRAAVFVLASAVAALAVTMSVEALRVRFFEFMQQKFPRYSTVTYEQVEEGYLAPANFIAYEPTYIPDGFVLENERSTPDSHSMRYRNAERKILFTFDQMELDEVNIDYDTEFASFEPVTVLGEEGYYLPNDSLKTIIWDDGNYYFEVSGHLDKKELLKIAESTKIKN